MLRKFIRRGENVIMGEEADRHLRYHSVSAVTIGQKTIMISSWANRSAVLEELYHTEQLKKMGKKSISDLTRIEGVDLEIDAQHYLLKNAKKLKLTDDEIQELNVNLAYWRGKKERTEDAESD